MDKTSTENNKRIAKNTLMLYVRMIVRIGVSLYTVRIVLDTLGSVDYGLFNVIAGIVTMFSFLSNTMASASQRYLTFELGRNRYDKLKKTFSMTMNIYIMIAVLILLLAETVGLWFLNTQLTIPLERMEAARWIYHFSILSFMMTIFTIPYNAAIIAHEEMNIYAWVSIVEVILKLLIVYLLTIFSFDKLKLYGVLTFSVTTLVTFIYRAYAIRKFNECKFNLYWNKKLFKELASYSGWSLFGSMAGTLKNQGVNILLNIFFGPIVNAARGIAFQIGNILNQFSSNFILASNPQIIKYHATGNKNEMFKLINSSSKFSYILLFLISFPLLTETNTILSIWLKDVPQYTVIFTRLILISVLIESLSLPLITAIQATGKIRKFQILVGGTQLLNLPLSYLFLLLGHPPETTMIITIILAIVSLFIRLIIIKERLQFDISNYFLEVIIPVIKFSVLSSVFPTLILFFVPHSTFRLITMITVGLTITINIIFYIGFTKSEKEIIKSYIEKKITKFKYEK